MYYRTKTTCFPRTAIYPLYNQTYARSCIEYKYDNFNLSYFQTFKCDLMLELKKPKFAKVAQRVVTQFFN